MAEKKNWKDIETVRIFKILLIAMSGIYAVGFIIYGVIEAPRQIKYLARLSDARQVVFNLSHWLGGIFLGLIYFWILYHLYRLLIVITKGEPFHAATPGRMRRIAYGAFALVVVRGAVNLAQGWASSAGSGPFMDMFKNAFISNLMGEGLRMILLGVGILIMAEVFEAGVRLKQDQDLTI